MSSGDSTSRRRVEDLMEWRDKVREEGREEGELAGEAARVLTAGSLSEVFDDA